MNKFARQLRANSSAANSVAAKPRCLISWLRQERASRTACAIRTSFIALSYTPKKQTTNAIANDGSEANNFFRPASRCDHPDTSALKAAPQTVGALGTCDGGARYFAAARVWGGACASARESWCGNQTGCGSRRAHKCQPSKRSPGRHRDGSGGACIQSLKVSATRKFGKSRSNSRAV